MFPDDCYGNRGRFRMWVWRWKLDFTELWRTRCKPRCTYRHHEGPRRSPFVRVRPYWGRTPIALAVLAELLRWSVIEEIWQVICLPAFVDWGKLRANFTLQRLFASDHNLCSGTFSYFLVIRWDLSGEMFHVPRNTHTKNVRLGTYLFPCFKAKIWLPCSPSCVALK